ncbi:hypothetical protein UPYG_G00021360 [Umbra pygmaea]|uniref:ADP-ribosylation factor-like protein 6-interacting protein 6 n=1 Tax=Umbra pygmaea TaxID=75934 RepID=A0ABD0XNW4_UMBPY
MDIQLRQRPVQQHKGSWDKRNIWPARIFSIFCCVAVVSMVALFCACLYLVLKELRTERVIQKDGSEVRLLGFWSILIMSMVAGVCCCGFTWTITYFDSFEPGMLAKTPMSPTILRQVTGQSFQMGYSVAVLNGIVAAITVVWSLI